MRSFFADLKSSSLVKDSSWLAASNGLIFCFSMIQSVAMARFLGVDGYGLFALITVYVTIVNQVFDFRVSEALVKYTSDFLAKADKPRALAAIKLCWFVDIVTGASAFLIIVFSAGFVAKTIFHRPLAGNLIAFYSVTLLFSIANNTGRGLLTIFRKFSWIAAYSVAIEFSRMSLVIALLFMTRSIEGVIVAQVITSIIGFAFLLYLAFKALNEAIPVKAVQGGIFLLKGYFGRIAKFLVNTSIHETLSIFTKNIDVLILGFFRNTAEAGYYKLAKSFVGVFALIGDPVYTAIYPRLASMWSLGNMKEFKSYILRITFFMSVLSLPLVLGFIFGMPVILKYILGIKFLGADRAAQIMLAGTLTGLIFFWVRPAFLSMGRPGTITAINFFLAVTMFFLSLLVVPVYGYIGSAAMYVYSYVAGHIASIIIFVRLIKRKYAD